MWGLEFLNYVYLSVQNKHRKKKTINLLCCEEVYWYIPMLDIVKIFLCIFKTASVVSWLWNHTRNSLTYASSCCLQLNSFSKVSLSVIYFADWDLAEAIYFGSWEFISVGKIAMWQELFSIPSVDVNSELKHSSNKSRYKLLVKGHNGAEQHLYRRKTCNSDFNIFLITGHLQLINLGFLAWFSSSLSPY